MPTFDPISINLTAAGLAQSVERLTAERQVTVCIPGTQTHLCLEMHAMARMAKNARRLAIQTGCQKWPHGEWRFWHKWRKITWPLVWHKQRKIARGLAISRMRQIFKLDAKFSFELLLSICRLIAISAIFATACISGHIPGPDQYSLPLPCKWLDLCLARMTT